MRLLGRSLRGGVKMYNLLVSADDESWDGEAFFLETSRCVREHTEKKLVDKYSDFSKSAIKKLLQYPCIFAYEKPCKKDPKFGYITNITVRQKKVRIEYQLIEMDNFLSHKHLEELLFELDINKLELNRTHWAIKNVDLETELEKVGITLPTIAEASNPIDITTHQFEVALSFPGEVRDYVESVANGLEKLIGTHSYFYDNNYKSQLARPSLDTLLQNIYRNQSKLIVVFLCAKYQEKDWCGLEFRAIKEIIMKRQDEKIMFIRMDDGKVDGVFDTDGYMDGRTHSPEEIAKYIVERVALLLKKEMK